MVIAATHCLMNQIVKTDLLNLDDRAFHKIIAVRGNDLMENIEEWHGLKATLIASRLTFDHLHDRIGEVTIAGTFLYRL